MSKPRDNGLEEERAYYTARANNADRDQIGPDEQGISNRPGDEDDDEFDEDEEIDDEAEEEDQSEE